MARKVIYYPTPKWLELSTATTSQLNLRIDTHSGFGWAVDWGDGNTIMYASGQNVTHTYASPYSGTVRVAPVGGFRDVDQFIINDNNSYWNFDISEILGLVNLSYLYLRGNSFTGDMSAVSNLTSLTTLYLDGNSLTGDMSGVSLLTSLTYLYLRGNSLTGDMSGVSLLTSLTYLQLQGNFTINYTSTTFAPNFQRWFFRPVTAINPMSSSEIDQMLADAAQTTWTGLKDIYVDGNNGVRTSASDADVATLQAVGVTLYLNV